MSAPTATHTALGNDDNMPCPPWCDPTRCGITPGESALHQHLIGTVAGIEVTVERIDMRHADGRIEIMPPRVHQHITGDDGLALDEVDKLATLISLAGMFLGEVS